MVELHGNATEIKKKQILCLQNTIFFLKTQSIEKMRRTTTSVAPLITRPARLIRFPDDADESDEIVLEQTYQYGDLLVFLFEAGDCEYKIQVYGDASYAVIRTMYIPLSVTNQFRDALAHYQTVIDEERARYKEGKQSFKFRFDLHPADEGLNQHFYRHLENASDIDLCRRWSFVTVRPKVSRRLQLQFQIVDVNFGTGAIAKKLFWGSMKPVVDKYRMMLQTLAIIFIVFVDVDFDENTGVEMNWALPAGWNIKGITGLSHRGDGSYVAMAYGEFQTMDRERLVVRMENFEFAMGERHGRERFKVAYVVLPDDTSFVLHQPPPIAAEYSFCALTGFFAPHKRFAIEWSFPGYQWRAVHHLILGIAIAFASLHLPPYVLLEILDWLPQCYHAIHYQKIQLIISTVASTRKVLAKRQTTRSRRTRAVRHVSLVK